MDIFTCSCGSFYVGSKLFLSDHTCDDYRCFGGFFFFLVSEILSCVCSSQLLLQGGIASLFAESVQICVVDCLTKFRIIFKSF